ncbi:MAG: hypothetical protein MUE99_11825, partial [Chitinophagaceae bacterium]|nr:hypothetical protein [Chitinophagaceae bacterium]
KATRELNAGLLTVMMEGQYTENYLSSLGSDAPDFTEEELKIIGSPLDFVGINVYFANNPGTSSVLKVCIGRQGL